MAPRSSETGQPGWILGSLRWISKSLITLSLLLSVSAQTEEIPTPLHIDDLDALEDKLAQAVIRIEVVKIPEPPYSPTPITLDGAAVYVRCSNGKTYWLTASLYLEDAQEVVVIYNDKRYPMDVVFDSPKDDLAIIAPSEGLPFEPVPLDLADAPCDRIRLRLKE